MALVKQMFALLAWLVIEIPTTLFVTYVMVKLYLEQRSKERSKTHGHTH